MHYRALGLSAGILLGVLITVSLLGTQFRDSLLRRGGLSAVLPTSVAGMSPGGLVTATTAVQDQTGTVVVGKSGPKSVVATSTPAGDRATSAAGLIAPSEPAPGAMTVYAITNSNDTDILVHHVITDSSGFRFEFSSTVPAGTTATYHLRDMPLVPSPFRGALTLWSNHPYVAEVVGYDYPPTPSVSVPTATVTR